MTEDAPLPARLPAADETVDCAGLLCPLPVLRARKRLLAMVPGQVLGVLATDGMAAVDLPHFCGQAGHAFLGSRPEGAATLYLIRAGAVAGAP
ncbi:sulfurtransferase TusA family protein [Neotabrizicola sp. VNH66]|uniref:sulfurtransferase TusA family protein n=1 Tax=Neotabrizicola sp. VNH66 TaxID=3400918 RepID=UPI003BFF5056